MKCNLVSVERGRKRRETEGGKRWEKEKEYKRKRSPVHKGNVFPMVVITDQLGQQDFLLFCLMCSFIHSLDSL